MGKGKEAAAARKTFNRLLNHERARAQSPMPTGDQAWMVEQTFGSDLRRIGKPNICLTWVASNRPNGATR